ncbi:MAG: arylsulfatase A-like enzyme [Planctomycetota bacterium]
MRAHGALLLIGLTLFSCEQPSTPQWISLTKDFRPSDQIEGEWEVPFTGGSKLTVERSQTDPDGVWVRAELHRSDWQESSSFPGSWQLVRPALDEGTPIDGVAQRLEGATQDYLFHPYSADAVRRNDPVPPNSFCGYLDQLYLNLEAGEEPAETLIYSTFVNRGRSRNGEWRLSYGRYQCDGIPVWSGHSEQVVADIPEQSALRFTSITRATSARGRKASQVTLRVFANESEVFSFDQAVSDEITTSSHVVDLSAHAGSKVSLRFESEGPATFSAFLTPVVGPLEIGKVGARPWKAERPNLVLFLADTFRADNLTYYGGQRGVTPKLDALVDRSLTFRRAWAPSSWTLPSQASMMSGLMPYQHGATRSLTALPEQAVTIAEVLESAGYRTEAITDAAFLSHRFAMDQGFQWFDELVEDKRHVAARDSFDVTLDRIDERLDADDGRPLFLYVQSYRVHFPYIVSDETKAEFGDRLSLDVSWKDLESALRIEGWDPGSPLPPKFDPIANALRELYLGGVVDFDRAFGSWMQTVESRGFFENSVLLFTSDHGEAFGEHDDLYHGTGVWESQIRIPFFLFGKGMQPSQVAHGVSLVDLPRSFADLAGVKPAPAWGGSSVFELDEDRPQYAFESSVYEQSAQAVIDGDEKLIVREDDQALLNFEVREAYDLGADSDETTNLKTSDAAWIEELAKRRYPELIQIRQRLLPELKVVLTSDDLDELENLGYTGDPE